MPMRVVRKGLNACGNIAHRARRRPCPVHRSTVDAAQLKDKVCKRLFRHRALVADLLRGYVPGRWVREIDFATLRRMPAEYVGRGGRSRFGDSLWLAGLHDGRQVMPMVEVQSGPDPAMAARMAAYVGMAYESLTPAARGPSERYPAVLPMVVYTGRTRWTAAAALRDLVDPVDGLAGYVAGRRYTWLDLCSLAEDDPRERNRLAVLAQLTGERSLAGMVEVLAAAASWLRPRDLEADDDDGSLFTDYLDWAKVLLPELEMAITPDGVTLKWRELMEELTVLEARAREWPQEWREEGRTEGIELGRTEGIELGRSEGIELGRSEGIEQGQRALLGRLAARRFGAAAGERLAAALADIRDPARLEAVGDLVLDCATEAELLGELNGKLA